MNIKQLYFFQFQKVKEFLYLDFRLIFIKIN